MNRHGRSSADGMARALNRATGGYTAIAQPQPPQRHSCRRQRSHPAAIAPVPPACGGSNNGMTGTMAQARRCGGHVCFICQRAVALVTHL